MTNAEIIDVIKAAQRKANLIGWPVNVISHNDTKELEITGGLDARRLEQAGMAITVETIRPTKQRRVL